MVCLTQLRPLAFSPHVWFIVCCPASPTGPPILRNPLPRFKAPGHGQMPLRGRQQQRARALRVQGIHKGARLATRDSRVDSSRLKSTSPDQKFGRTESPQLRQRTEVGQGGKNRYQLTWRLTERGSSGRPCSFYTNPLTSPDNPQLLQIGVWLSKIGQPQNCLPW